MSSKGISSNGRALDFSCERYWDRYQDSPVIKSQVIPYFT